MSPLFTELKDLVTDTDLEVNLIKAEQGNKAARTRVRVAMQRIKGKAQEIRIVLAPPKSAK